MAQRRGRTTAVEVRSTRTHQVNRDCMEILRKMPSWSWDEYREALAARANTTQNRRVEPAQSSTVITDYTCYCPDPVSYTLTREKTKQRLYIPESVLDLFSEEFDYRDVANSSELTNMTMALFIGILDTPTVSARGGGGGSQSVLPWRDKDEDDLQWARLCARAAARRLGKNPRTGLKR